MNCPVCRKNLVEWKSLKLETLDDHVCNPNGEGSMRMAYHCQDEKCPTRIHGIFWDYEGELFTKSYVKNMNMINFADNNNAPFGSFQRCCNVEVYKKDENKLLVTLPLWFPGVLSGMKIRSRWIYKSNYNGDILSRKLGFDYITKKGIYHCWGLRMLWYGLRLNMISWSAIKKNPNDKWMRERLEDSANRGNWDRAEWWRKINAKIAGFMLNHSPENNA